MRCKMTNTNEYHRDIIKVVLAKLTWISDNKALPIQYEVSYTTSTHSAWAGISIQLKITVKSHHFCKVCSKILQGIKCAITDLESSTLYTFSESYHHRIITFLKVDGLKGLANKLLLLTSLFRPASWKRWVNLWGFSLSGIWLEILTF